MRFRIFVGAAALVGLVGVATLAARGASACGSGCCAADRACCSGGGCCDEGGCTSCDREAAVVPSASRQTTIVNFMDTLLVGRTLVTGPVLMVHDDAKMARGEPCTTIYRFDHNAGPKEALVSFHCKPRRAARAENTVLTTEYTSTGIKRLSEYQIAGDTEAHGVPW